MFRTHVILVPHWSAVGSIQPPRVGFFQPLDWHLFQPPESKVFQERFGREHLGFLRAEKIIGNPAILAAG